MNENQFNPKPGYQQNQPLQDNLTDNHTLTGIYQEENSENRDINQKEFPDRTQQHNDKNPSANQIEIDEEEMDEDELNTDGEAFDRDYENNISLLDEQPTDKETSV